MRTNVAAFVGVVLLVSGCGGDEPIEEPSSTARQASVADVDLHGDALPPYTLSLTYDDGPDAHTLDIATYLHSQGIRATFFINGCRLMGRPTPIPQNGGCEATPSHSAWTLDALVALGHRVANHTQDHPHLPLLVPDAAAITSQLRLTQALVDPRATDGYSFFRAPHGEWNPSIAAAVRTDATLDKLTGPMHWEINADDWACFGYDGRSVTVEQCGQAYLNALSRRPNRNGVILLHDRLEYAVGSDLQLQLTRWLVEHLPRAQYTFVPLDAIPSMPGTRQAATATRWTTHFSNAEGWNASPGLYGTIRFADLNGDGRADVCGRRSTGVRCALSTGSSFAAWSTWTSSEFTDAAGWSPEKHSSTLQLGDVNGDGRADLCGRGYAGMICTLSTGSAFGPAIAWSTDADFSDPQGWGANVGAYGSLRLGDVNGDGRADACGRSSTGLVCALSDGTRFLKKTAWKTDDFTNLAGWLPPEHSTTLQLGDKLRRRHADAERLQRPRPMAGLQRALPVAAPRRRRRRWARRLLRAQRDGHRLLVLARQLLRQLPLPEQR